MAKTPNVMRGKWIRLLPWMKQTHLPHNTEGKIEGDYLSRGREIQRLP
jgi:hypothetical protein